MDAGGAVRAHGELERAEPADLTVLRVIAWDPGRGQLLRVDFPFWFVRARMTETINLGTLVSALSRDWSHLNLRVSKSDLQRRGPGLVLDHTLSGGAHVLLWTE